MKKYLYIGFLLTAFIANAQIKTNLNISQNAIPAQTPFLDASSSNTWNSSTNQGKGLVFPRTDLTAMTSLIATPNGLPASFPTRLDGMVVYNTGTGEAKTGVAGVNVVPGFYYYENKSRTLNGGTWKPLGASSTTVAGSQVATGTFTHDGGITAVLANMPTDVKAITGIKIVRTDDNGDVLSGGVAATTFYSYEKATKKIAFGQGAMATSMPAGTYSYTVEYTK